MDDVDEQILDIKSCREESVNRIKELERQIKFHEDEIKRCERKLDALENGFDFVGIERVIGLKNQGVKWKRKS